MAKNRRIQGITSRIHSDFRDESKKRRKLPTILVAAVFLLDAGPGSAGPGSAGPGVVELPVPSGWGRAGGRGRHPALIIITSALGLRHDSAGAPPRFV